MSILQYAIIIKNESYDNISFTYIYILSIRAYHVSVYRRNIMGQNEETIITEG